MESIKTKNIKKDPRLTILTHIILTYFSYSQMPVQNSVKIIQLNYLPELFHKTMFPNIRHQHKST